MQPNAAPIHIPFAQLRSTLERIFLCHGTSAEVAAVLAHNCASAERDGALSHGVFRMAGYLSSLGSGWVNGQAVPQLQDLAPGYLAVDAGNGFAQPALHAAYPALVEKARRNGIALLAIRNSHHFAALWPDVEPLARDGLLGLTVVNSMACVVPHGGQRPLFGTNPIAFAAPRAQGDPLVFDLATSALAHGDVQLAARAGRPLTPDQGVDQHGHPTCDPNAVLNGGALLPFGGAAGGHKGSALSMMVELLAAGLTGGNFSFEFDWGQHPGAQTPWTGQLVIAIQPATPDSGPGQGQHFAQRCEALVHAMADAGQPRQPGQQRYRQRAQSLAQGIALTPSTWQQLLQWAQPPAVG